MNITVKCSDCGVSLGTMVHIGHKGDIVEERHCCFHALNKKILIIKVLSWMIEDMKVRFDEQRSNFGQDITGGYSPELTEAIELLESMKKEVNAKKEN